MTARPLEVGINLNNRDALLSETFDLPALLALGERAEALGVDSLWVGDSLFSKPRWEALTLLTALSQRTTRVRLGTACLVTPLREPVGLALAWATLDQLAGGRTILGACAGNHEEGVQREFAATGLDYRARFSRFEESLQVLRQLWSTGRVSFEGRHFRLDEVAFHSGTEVRPLAPQGRPPIWVVSNARIADRADRADNADRADDATARRGIESPARRVVRFGDGWMTCCRATHPEEVTDFRSRLDRAAAELDRPTIEDVAYQVTVNIGTGIDAARDEFRRYISAYYPEFGPQVDLADWGPAGTADDVATWLRTFHDAGVTHAIVRFASFDQEEQLARFADAVLPQLADLRNER